MRCRDGRTLSSERESKTNTREEEEGIKEEKDELYKGILKGRDGARVKRKTD